MIEAGGVGLCTESFGDPGAPPILLVMGMGASMVWWDERFCELLARGGRFVLRYDHRDTGQSVSYEPGRPGYAVSDLVADMAGVLDAYDLPAAHIVGLSMGGGLAQLLALDSPGRVLSLVLISTSPVTPGERGLPGSRARLGRFLAGARVDWSDPESVLDYVVAHWHVLWGERRHFDEAYIRSLAQHHVERARDVAAMQNHGVLRDEPDGGAPARCLSAIRAPTLVIHGTDDPMFPIEHSAALADEISGAELLALEGAGHGLDPVDWTAVAEAILRHTVSPRAAARRRIRPR